MGNFLINQKIKKEIKKFKEFDSFLLAKTGRFKLEMIKLGLVKSGQFKSGQVKSGLAHSFSTIDDGAKTNC